MSVTKKNERDLIGARYIKNKATKMISLDESKLNKKREIFLNNDFTVFLTN